MSDSLKPETKHETDQPDDIADEIDDKLALNDDHTDIPSSKPKKKKSKKKKQSASSHVDQSITPSVLPDVSPSAERDANLFSNNQSNHSFKCHVEYDPRQGRHAVINQSIKAGDLIMIDEPYAFVVSYEKRMHVCHHCMSEIDHSIKQTILHCTDCYMVNWCSQKCRDQSIQYRHSLECPMLKQISSITPTTKIDPTMLTLLIAVYSRRYREVNQLNKQSLDGDLTLEHVMDLVYHQSLFNSQWIESIKQSMTLLLPHTPDPSLLSADQLVEIAQRINCNSHSCCSLNGDFQSVNGIGIYPRVAILNHSCRPNCVYVTEKYGRMAVRAIVDVNQSANQSTNQLTTFYCDLYDDRESRQRNLYQTKAFVCTCERCIESINQSTDLLLGGVSCPCSNNQTSTQSINQTNKQTNKQSINQTNNISKLLDQIKRGVWIEQADLEQLLKDSTINHSTINQSSNQAWIVYQGKVDQPRDQNRKDYACVACRKKYSFNDIESIKKPMHELWEQVVHHKDNRAFDQCLLHMFKMLALNNQSSHIVTNYHPIMMQVYVLLYSLTSHLKQPAIAATFGRLIVICYETVFPANFTETCDWYQATVDVIKQSIQHMEKSKLVTTKTISQTINHLKEYEEKWKAIKQVCMGEPIT